MVKRSSNNFASEKYSESEILSQSKKVWLYLQLKPVKTYHEPDRTTKRKANCDVDMTFDMMRMIDKYSEVVILSGDGDFAILLKYLIKIGKKPIVLARSERTAKEIRQLMKSNFRDFHYLKYLIRFKENKK